MNPYKLNIGEKVLVESIFLYLLFLLPNVLFAQNPRKYGDHKPTIDTSVLGKWPFVNMPRISNDGRYIAYIINQVPKESNTLVIKDSSTRWIAEYVGPIDPSSVQFSSNSKKIAFQKKDTLIFLTLGTSESVSILNVKNFTFFESQSQLYLVYSQNKLSNEFIIYNISNYQQHKISGVTKYWLLKPNNNLLLKTETIINNKNTISLKLLNLDSKIEATICRTEGDLQNVILSQALNQIVFLQERNSGNTIIKDLWYYQLGMDSAKLLVKHSDVSLKGFDLSRIDKFSYDGRYIFFKVKRRRDTLFKSNTAKVDVWSYKDPILQSAQLKLLDPSYTAVVNIESRQAVLLENEGEKMVSESGDYALITKMKGSGDEWRWNKASFPEFDLVSLLNGSSKRILENHPAVAFYNPRLSPSGNYVIFYDPVIKNYYHYEISSGSYRVLTKDLKAVWTSQRDIPGVFRNPISIAGFYEAEETMLLYDQFDIFQIDLTQKQPPINLTNGFGRKNNIVFRLINNANNKLVKSKPLILNAFDRKNKHNGFYRISEGRSLNPELLLMEPCVFVGPESESTELSTEYPIKAKYADVFVFRKMSADSACNYYLTIDFKKIKCLTELYPEKSYNWLTSELVKWKALDGKKLDGILYKPENFDPTKKYPIIFSYYEKLSGGLYNYIIPDFSDRAFINIPYYVSNGYLVFCPDISYEVGYPGRSAFNSIVSAAKYLSAFSWVDSTKMGLVGHSFGGYETLYLITHTKMFTASVAGAAVSNFISGYGSLLGNKGESRQNIYENSQSRMGITIWEAPELYIKNSPIFCANKVTTPALLNSNINDGQVPFSQGIEFFTALRRLGKSAWLLQYDGEDHGLSEKKNCIDLTIRVKQFFDHYLKHAPAPIWMSQGIPAKVKGIETGYALDPSGNCGKDCKVCKKWNEKMNKDSVETKKEIEERKKVEHWME